MCITHRTRAFSRTIEVPALTTSPHRETTTESGSVHPATALQRDGLELLHGQCRRCGDFGGFLPGAPTRLLVELGEQIRRDLEKRLDEIWVEVLPALCPDLVERLFEGPPLLVGTFGDQRVEDVAESTDPAGQRDVVLLEAVGIPRAVPALVVRPGDGLGQLYHR